MSKDFMIAGNREIILVSETIAREKGISVDEILFAMEEGIRLAARKKYGHDLVVECKIDRKSGAINLFNKLEIIDDEFAKTEDFNSKMHITLEDAKNLAKYSDENKEAELEIGGFVRRGLPPIDLSRVVAQVAKNEIIRRVKEAEKLKEYNDFIERQGEIVYGSVKKVGVKNVVVDVEGYESVLHKEDMIPTEIYKVGDRVKAVVSEVRRENKGAQIFLSRSKPLFLAKLFEQEVPEMYDGVIEAKAIARDPGSRAKLAVFSRESHIDVVGSCIGVRGSRVQAVTSELRGEKIDIIEWSPNLADLVVSALTPAKVTKVIVDEENGVIEVVVPEDQLSLAIGRGGQNVRLTSQLVGYKIDVMTDAEEGARRKEEFEAASQVFVETLDVEDVIAQLLATEGFMSVEDLVEADIDEIESIEGFDKDIATEIQNRAIEWLKNNTPEIEESEESAEETENTEE